MTSSGKSPSQSASIKTSRTQKVLLVFFGLGLFMLGLVLLEGLFGLLDVGDPYSVEDPYVGFVAGNDLFEPAQENGRRVWRTRQEKLGFFNDQAFGADKADGTLRIFALGGSTTAGRPYDWRVAFPHWLELFASEATDRPVEVVNAGGISYASYRIAVLMEELMRHEPDVFVLYTGHNEFLEQRTYSDIIDEPAWRRRFRVWSNGLRSFTFAREQLRSLHSSEEEVTELSEEVQAKLDVWNGLDLFERDDALQASILGHFEHNLRQMAALAEAHGIPLILVEPISNLKDFSPFKSQGSDGLAPEQVDIHRRRLEEGIRHLSAGADAVETLRAAVEADPLHAETSYRLGQALMAVDRVGEAEASFIRAKDLDVCPLRALEATKTTLKNVASQTGTTLIDLPSLVAEHNHRRHGHGVLGKEMLIDHVHPTIEVHRWIALSVLDELVRKGLLELQPSWNSATREHLIEEHMATLDQGYYARRDLNLSKVLGWAGKYEEALEPLERAVQSLYDEPEVFRNLGVVYQKLGRPGDALQAHQRAVELDASIPESYFNLGVVFAELGQWQRSVQALTQALELRAEYPEARFNLAIALRELGELDQAGSLMQALRESGWQSPAMARQTALLEVQRARRSAEQSRFDDAEVSYRKALNLSKDPGLQTKVYNDLGVLFGRLNRLNEAEKELRKALEIQPSFADAHFNLALIYGNQGRLRESLDHLHSALELDPGNARYEAALATLESSLGS